MENQEFSNYFKRFSRLTAIVQICDGLWPGQSYFSAKRGNLTEPFAKVHLKSLFRNFGGSLLQVRQGVACYDAKHLEKNAPKGRKVAKATFAKGSITSKTAGGSAGSNKGVDS